ncbi:MAG: DUF3164 family protein [Leeuwenhoekiella sp.]
METAIKDPKEMSAKELQALLADKLKEEKAQADREKKAYERKRDETINFLINRALEVSGALADLKELCETKMEEQAEHLNNYGMIRSNSKGGFSITNTEGDFRITRRRDTEPKWDERSLKAQDLIKEFLTETVKKRDLKLYQILISFIERNDQGDLEYARVMNLLQHADKYDDPRWVEGLKLIKESYSNHLKGFGYELKRKGKNGKWETVGLQFSSL